MSPAQRVAYRGLLEEIRDGEVEIARLRCRYGLLRAGAHPQQSLVEAVLAWGFALHDTYGRLATKAGGTK